MAKFVNHGDSIECRKSFVVVRSGRDSPIRIKIDSISYFKYKSKTRSIAIISEELDPKKHRISESSNLCINDTLEAEKLEIYTEKQMKFGLISNFSHVHGIKGEEVNGFLYAKIAVPFRLFLEKGLDTNQSKLNK